MIKSLFAVKPTFALASLFSWDRQNESVLGHHHLIAAYCFAWGLQLAYLAYVGLQWRSLQKTGGRKQQ